MYKLLVIYSLSCLVVGALGKTVSFITPCKQDDQVCQLASAKTALPKFAEGIPEIGIPTADPLEMHDIVADNEALKLKFRGMTVAGLKKCQVSKIIVTTTSHIDLDIECPVTVTGQYTVNGKLIGVPIEGDGDFNIKTDKIKLTFKIGVKKVKGEDGKEYLAFTSFEKSYELEEQVYLDLKNLFNGDEAKAKPILDILNVSWKEVTLGIGKPVIEEIIDKVKDHVVKFFAAVPLDELVL